MSNNDNYFDDSTTVRATTRMSSQGPIYDSQSTSGGGLAAHGYVDGLHSGLTAEEHASLHGRDGESAVRQGLISLGIVRPR